MEEFKRTIKRTLENNTGYKISKETGLALNAVQKLQNGSTSFEKMTLKTAERLYNFGKDVEREDS